MKTATLFRPGGPEYLCIVERPVPVAVDEQVLIRVKAFGLNRSELMTRKGFSLQVQFPRVLGIECVGEVAYDPSGILKKGQQIAAFMGGMGRDFDGSYAEYTVLPRSIIIPFESNLNWEILGALPEMFQTAFGSLQTALQIAKGEHILIRGGSSSVGLLSTQLAKINGLYVISTTRNPNKKNCLSEHGSDEVFIDNGDLSSQVKNLPYKIDKVLELVGTETLQDSLNCVKPGGIVCMTGMLSEKWTIEEFAPMDYIPAGVYLTVYDSGRLRVEGTFFQEFIKDIEKGSVLPVIKHVFKLDEIVDAHKLMESNTGVGKIVVTIE
ncbi:zinc-binding alcohol dehydrogenase family protein [Sinomicrobium sp. M5D2P17]